MIIRDTPSDIEKYFAADEEIAFAIHQAGIKPSYIDDGTVYFKKSKKLEKVLKKLNIEL